MITIIGPHKVNCGSLVSGEVDQMLAGETVAVFYSDPPWGDGNLAYWKTMAKKMTGQDLAQVNHDQMYDRIMELIAKHVRGWVFVETGLRWRDYVVQRFLNGNLGAIATFRLQYGSGAKLYDNVLVCGSTVPANPLSDAFNPSGLRGAKLVQYVVGSVARSGGLVLDPCCGMGYTAKAAVAAGMRFAGNELNQARLDKTIAFLRKHERT